MAFAEYKTRSLDSIQSESASPLEYDHPANHDKSHVVLSLPIDSQLSTVLPLILGPSSVSNGPTGIWSIHVSAQITSKAPLHTARGCLALTPLDPVKALLIFPSSSRLEPPARDQQLSRISTPRLYFTGQEGSSHSSTTARSPMQHNLA